MAGGGVGEAMLIGAAIGGGSAAVTGGDPLKGALLGGLTGGAGAGLPQVASSLAGAGAGTVTGATTAAAEGALAAGAGAGTAGAAGAGSAGIPALLPNAAQSVIAPPVPMGAAAPSMGTSALSLPSTNPLVDSMVGGTGPVPFQSTVGTRALNATMANTLPVSSSATAGGVPSLSGAAPTAASTAPSSFQAAMQDPLAYIKANPLKMGAAGIAGATGARRPMEEEEEYSGPLSRFRFNPETYRPAFASGGITDLAAAGYDRMVGEQPMYQRMASGGISDLGTYSDGGRMLRGPGDGMSDSIPGVIGGKRPARLADGEFVVPADVVSGLGNGSTDAGARQLYAMMDKVRKARTGTKKQGREINPRKYVPA